MVELVQFREAVQFFQIINQHICTRPNHVVAYLLLDKNRILSSNRRLKQQSTVSLYARYAFYPKRLSTKAYAVESAKNRGLGRSSVEA